MQFKTIIAQYCDVKPEEMTNDMRFREDLGFSSLDFMSFLGELEDTFDIVLEEENALRVFTIAEALALLETLPPPPLLCALKHSRNNWKTEVHDGKVDSGYSGGKRKKVCGNNSGKMAEEKRNL